MANDNESDSGSYVEGGKRKKSMRCAKNLNMLLMNKTKLGEQIRLSFLGSHIRTLR